MNWPWPCHTRRSRAQDRQIKELEAGSGDMAIVDFTFDLSLSLEIKMGGVHC
jgi:hypothetical protein